MCEGLLYKLHPAASGIVCHGLEETANRFLVEGSDGLVLPDDSIFSFRQCILSERGSNAVKDVWNVEPNTTRGFAQVRGRRVAGSSLVVSLRPLRNSERLGHLVLSHAETLPFFLQARTYFFRKMQNYSSGSFTNAPKCIIVHSTPHETARNCTMPNTCTTEQARKQAREALEKRGLSAKDFAKQHDLNPSTVYAVLSGQSHCRRGEAHRAAVLLGIKDGVIEQ